MIAAAVLCGALGGFAGWRFAHPLYTSEGLIRVAYAVPEVMRETDQNRPLEMYDAFMRSQQMILSSYRIIQLALDEPEWTATGRGKSQEAAERFAKQLVVDRPNGSEHLRVSFSDPDRVVAAAAVRSVIDAYVKSYTADDRQLQEQRFRALDDRCATLRQQLQQLDATTRVELDSAGAQNVEQLYDDAARRLSSLTMRLEELQVAQALAQVGRPPGPLGTADETAGTWPGTGAAASYTDDVRNQFVADVMRWDRELRRLTLLGLGPNHREVVNAAAQLRDAKAQLNAYDWQRTPGASPNASAAAPTPSEREPRANSSTTRPTDSLQTSVATLSRMVDDATAELTRLGTKRDQVAAAKARIARLQQELDQTTDRRQTLQLESTLSDRLEVISNGEVSMQPATDGRLKFGAVGAVGAASLPCALFMTLGAMSRRFRFAEDATGRFAGEQPVPLLGILPMMRGSAATFDQSEDVAHCIHQIRARLQFDQGPECRIFLVSSAMPREGKTSLSVALSFSLAASGARTLLIDADFIGQGVTRGFNAEDLPGLNEALNAGTIDGFTHQRGAGLTVMPAGQVDQSDAGTMSSRLLRPLLAKARQKFEVVVIDSGPILGSVEATIVAPEVDGVIFAVERGQDQRVVARAVERLKESNVHIAGFVFNRAVRSDAERSYSGSVRSDPGRNVVRRSATQPGKPLNPSRFGPIVDSITCSLPRSANGR